MKAILKGKVQSMDKKGSGIVAVQLVAVGKVQGVPMSAKETNLTLILDIKELVAEQMKFGSIITVTITDEDPDSKVD